MKQWAEVAQGQRGHYGGSPKPSIVVREDPSPELIAEEWAGVKLLRWLGGCTRQAEVKVQTPKRNREVATAAPWVHSKGNSRLLPPLPLCCFSFLANLCLLFFVLKKSLLPLVLIDFFLLSLLFFWYVYSPQVAWERAQSNDRPPWSTHWVHVPTFLKRQVRRGAEIREVSGEGPEPQICHAFEPQTFLKTVRAARTMGTEMPLDFSSLSLKLKQILLLTQSWNKCDVSTFPNAILPSGFKLWLSSLLAKEEKVKPCTSHSRYVFYKSSDCYSL